MKRLQKLLIILLLLNTFQLHSQQIIDSCFTSTSIGTSFPSSTQLANAGNNADLCEWDGSQWNGDWPNANLTIAPPSGQVGCHAIFIGSGTAWTTGGEGFALQLNAPLVAGNNYSYNFTYVSQGLGSNGAFQPEVYTNTTGNLGGAFQMANLPPVGYAWTTNTYTFTAAAAQAGHTYIIVHSGSSGTTSSGMVNNFCHSCNTFVPPPCDDPTITAAGPFCVTDAAVNLTAADPGGTWSGTGITNTTNGTFDPAVAGAGTHTITYDLGCDSDTETITVNATDDPSFTYPQANYCTNDTDPTPTITGLAGGTFSISGAGSINTSSGVIDLDVSGAGPFTITYLTNGPCPTSTTFNITIASATDATITAAGPFCETDASVNLTAVDGGGVWSGTGVTDANLGTFDPATAGAGTHTITYTIAGTCGDTDTEDITVNATDDPSFNYSQGSYCLTDPDPTPTITGLAGGTFTINNGGVINAASGQVDITASGTGNYTITYTTNGPCPTSTDFNLTLSSTTDATITPAGPFCTTDAAVNLSAVDAGGTWSGTGITDANLGTFDPATAGAGTHTITYTIAGSCGDTDTEDIVVNATDDPTFNYVTASYCMSDPNPTPTITGLAGGTFSINNGGIINATTGEVDLGASGAGTFDVTYTTNGPCPSSSVETLTIAIGGSATITAAGPFCADDPAVNLSAASAGGTWSGAGITDPNLGAFDPATAGAGTHTITYTITGSCGDADTEDIVVNAADGAIINYPQAAYCTADTDPNVSITGTIGGTFSIDNGGVINAGTGEVDLDASGAGTFTITYSTTGPCPTTATFVLTIGLSSDPLISPAGPFCIGSGMVVLTASPSGGVWSGNGIMDTLTGFFNVDTAGVGLHDIVYTIGGTCGEDDTIGIEVNPIPTITTIPDTTIQYPNCINLFTTGGSTYSWTPDTDLDCNDCSSPEACPIYATEYCVTATDTNGCTNSDCVLVNVEINCGDVFVPSAFSPNNDSENDLECVYSDCIETMTFSVYNRWGEKVFETNNQNICWDGTWKGKELNSAVFVYVLDAYLINGEHIVQKGNISLIR